MYPLIRHSALLTGVALLLVAPLQAQSFGGPVLAPGAVRLDVSGVHTHAEREFDESGRRALGAWYGELIGDAARPPVEQVRTGLFRFFDATGAPLDVPPASVHAGDTVTRFLSTTRHVPIRLAIGILPRVEFMAQLPLERDELLVQAIGFTGGSLGINPAPAANEAVLRQIGEEWAELGSGTFLPLANSPLGQVLLARVEELTDEALTLPDASIGIAGSAELLQRLGESLPTSGLRSWRVGDLELGARVLALSSFGAIAFPEPGSARLDYRIAATLAVRLPTGSEAPDRDRFSRLASTGHTGIMAGVDADVFVGERFWLAGGASLRRHGGSEIEDEATTSTVIWSPASELRLGVSPRYRITPGISVGGHYHLAHSGAQDQEWLTEASEFSFTSPSGTVHRGGLEFRYSMLPTGDGSAASGLFGPLAVELAAGYLSTLAGPPGIAADGLVFIEASLHHRLWGGN